MDSLVAAMLFTGCINCYGKNLVKKNVQPVLIDSAAYIYSAADFYIAGQPTKSDFIELKNNGLTLVINLRTDDEMEEFTSENFNEEEFLRAEGIEYFHLSVGGSDGYNPYVVDQIEGKIKEADGKVMIHCRSAGRATLVWMAWLVRYDHHSVNNVVRIGKLMRYSFPFEEILGREIKMRKAI